MILSAILLSLLPYMPAAETHVERLELNHFYRVDSEGQLEETFTQVIVWRRESDGHWHVADWRIAKDEKQWPRRSACGGYQWIFNDRSGPRRVRTRFLLETWTLHDREMVDRAAWNTEWRTSALDTKERR